MLLYKYKYLHFPDFIHLGLYSLIRLSKANYIDTIFWQHKTFEFFFHCSPLLSETAAKTFQVSLIKSKLCQVTDLMDWNQSLIHMVFKVTLDILLGIVERWGIH